MPPPSIANRHGRAIRPAVKFGTRGEQDQGPASAFRSTPVAPKQIMSLAEESSVPAFAMPGGGQIWAYGLHAGVRKRFKARVLKLRVRFPRIVVRYEETETGETHPLSLPEMPTAFLTAADVEEMDE